MIVDHTFLIPLEAMVLKVSFVRLGMKNSFVLMRFIVWSKALSF
ncbi:hypothetical protein MNBD_ALPHA11-1352 [hydrothermal vent metagenome]|uniref:Uncharacterized protein n=1 Tax=hydrothermal vent metagenome TaxID=652676 RepID=A0A3B0T849_9ZZZZ